MHPKLFIAAKNFGGAPQRALVNILKHRPPSLSFVELLAELLEVNPPCTACCPRQRVSMQIAQFFASPAEHVGK